MRLFESRFYYILVLLSLLTLSAGNVIAVEIDTLSLKDNETIKIDSIRVEGNDITQKFIILRELTFKEGDTVTGKTLRYNRERVFSLQLFSQIVFTIKEIEKQNILIIRLYESWYIYPIPFVRMQDGNLKQGTYGASILWRNFRGRDEVLRTSLGFGYNSFYSLLYQNPALDHENSIGLQLFFAYAEPTIKSLIAQSIVGYEYRNNVYSNSVSVSKRLNQFSLINVSAGFDYIEAPIAQSGITASGGKVDRSLSLSVNYIFDSRDLKQFSASGFYSSVQFTHKGFGLDGISYNIFDLDYREYSGLIGELSGKWRINYNAAFGRLVPYYDYSILGLFERIRGHMNDIREGQNYLLTSFEISYPLLKEWDFHLRLPLIPEKLTSARIGIYLTSFFDTGAAYTDTSQLSFDSFYSGYGVGLTVLVLPYNAFRFEFAKNELGKGELIIGTGFSF